MAHSTSSGNRFINTDRAATSRPHSEERCKYGICRETCFGGLPVCFMCAVSIGQFMENMFERFREDGPSRHPEVSPDEFFALKDYVDRAQTPLPVQVPNNSVVYYLMLSPVTVKIGTTRHLRSRMSSLRTDMQYVVALEQGGRELESERHRQFNAERRDSRREDFQLSAALKGHIDNLAERRDEVMAWALDT